MIKKVLREAGPPGPWVSLQKGNMMLKSLKINAGGKSLTVDIESLKALHCKELKDLKEKSARSLTEVFFKDRAYLKKWLSSKSVLKQIIKKRAVSPASL